MKINDIEEFKQLILSGKTIKELQDYYGCSRTEVTDCKRIHGLVGLSPNSKKLDRESGIKSCNSCKLDLPLEYFYSNGKTPSGKLKYKPTCKDCENSSRNTNYWNLISEYLSINGKKYACETCGDTDSYGFLDWHHKDPLIKDFEIGSISRSMSVDLFFEEVVPELEKCKLLCPNCHRREHLLMGLSRFDKVTSTEADNSAM